MPTLHEAVCAGNLREIQRLLAKGADVQERDAKTGRTPLMSACLSESAGLEIVRLLIGRGADISHRSPSGYTLLMDAACRSRFEVMAAKLRAGSTRTVPRL